MVGTCWVELQAEFEWPIEGCPPTHYTACYKKNDSIRSTIEAFAMFLIATAENNRVVQSSHLLPTY